MRVSKQTWRLGFAFGGPNMLGGPNVWLARHLPRLHDRGLIPVVFYYSYFPERACQLRGEFEAAGYLVVNIRLERCVEDTIAATLRAVEAAQLDAFVPGYIVPANFATQALRAAGVRVIGMLHSDDPFYEDLREMFISGAAERAYSGVVVVSEFLRRVVSAANPGMPCLTAPYGVPLPSERADTPAGRLEVIYAGRLVEQQKRIGRVVSAMLAAARGHPRVSGIIYGEGEACGQVQARLAAECAEDRVALAGRLDAQALQRALLRGHVFLLLSDFEGFSIALMEAMAAGLVPIVARMRSGVGDIIQHGANGFVVDGDDPGEVARLCGSLADDPREWRRLSDAARDAMVSGGLTSDCCADRWVDFVNELMGLPEPGIARRAAGDDASLETLAGLPPRSSRPYGTRAEDRRRPDRRIGELLKSGRPLWLWGRGQAAERFLEAQPRVSASIAAVIDSKCEPRGESWRSYDVSNKQILEGVSSRSIKPFVFVASQYVEEIEPVLQRESLRCEEDYLFV